jgi:hypothetical protein
MIDVLSSWPLYFHLKELVDINSAGYKKLQETAVP